MLGLLYSLTYNVLTRVVLFIISLFCVKLLSVNEYGSLSYSLVLISTLAIISLMGGGTAINRSFSKQRGTGNFDLSNQILVFNFIISALIVSLVSIGLYFYFDNWLYFFCVALIFTFMTFNSIFEGAMYGLAAYKALAINSLFVLIVSLPISYFLIIQFRALGALFALVLYRVIIFVLNALYLIKNNILSYPNVYQTFKNKEVIHSFKHIALPTFISSLLVTPVMLILLSFLKAVPNGISQIAYFSWVNQIYSLTIFLPSVLGGFLISRMSQNEGRAYDMFMRTLVYNFIFGCFVSLVLFLSKDLVLGMGGKVYVVGAGQIYDFMLLTICAYCLNSAFGSLWTSINKAYLGLLNNIVWALLSVVLGYLLIYKFHTGDKIFISIGIAYLATFLLQIFLYLKVEKF